MTSRAAADQTRAALQAQARLLGLRVSGTKAEIDARIDAALVAQVQADTAASAAYTVGTWHGYTNYSCRRCPYASLRRRAMLIHQADTHGGDQ